MWSQLREVMDTWSMPHGERPWWPKHFAVCITRYSFKYLRTRRRTYSLLVVSTMLGVLCGSLHGEDLSRNDTLVYFLLFNTMFGSICATFTLNTFGGGPEVMTRLLPAFCSPHDGC